MFNLQFFVFLEGGLTAQPGVSNTHLQIPDETLPFMFPPLPFMMPPPLFGKLKEKVAKMYKVHVDIQQQVNEDI